MRLRNRHTQTLELFSSGFVCLFQCFFLSFIFFFSKNNLFRFLFVLSNLGRCTNISSWLLAVLPLQLYAFVVAILFGLYCVVSATLMTYSLTHSSIPHNVRKQPALLFFSPRFFFSSLDVSVVKLVYNDFQMFIACGNSDICNETTSTHKKWTHNNQNIQCMNM